VILGALLLLISLYEPKPWSPPGGEASTLARAYRRYRTTEFPKRGDRFYGLAFALSMRSKAVPILRPDLFRCLGKPNFTKGDPDNGVLVFVFRPSKAKEDWEIFAVIRGGKMAEMGFSPASANDHTGYKPYSDKTLPSQDAEKRGP
jgi:hypothetical protein